MLSLIVAMTPARVIGQNNQLPWHLPADLQHFKSITLGKSVIMGRKTFESIGRLLPGRQNIILTRDTHWSFPGADIAHDLNSALNLCETEERFVIGGGVLFEASLALADTLYITWVQADIKGDTFFPVFNPKEWETLSSEQHAPDERHAYAYEFVCLKRKP